MEPRIRIVAQGSTFRMIYRQAYGYAVVEVRNGFVYSTDPHHTCCEHDTDDGMTDVAHQTGWTSETEARRKFDALVLTGRHLAKEIR